MTDKEKILNEIKRRLRDNMLSYQKDKRPQFNKLGRIMEDEDLLSFIDSLQEEPAPKILEDMLNAKTAAESLGISQEEHDRIVDELIYGKEPEMVDIDDLPKEEPVSEDLEKASKEWLTPQLDKSYAVYGEAKMMELTKFDGYAMLDAIEFGVNWQKKKYDVIGKDLDEAAENYAQEAYSHPVDREVGKADFILGAKWQFERVNEALLSEVLPFFMHGGEADEVVAKLEEVLNQKK